MVGRATLTSLSHPSLCSSASEKEERRREKGREVGVLLCLPFFYLPLNWVFKYTRVYAAAPFPSEGMGLRHALVHLNRFLCPYFVSQLVAVTSAPAADSETHTHFTRARTKPTQTGTRSRSAFHTWCAGCGPAPVTARACLVTRVWRAAAPGTRGLRLRLPSPSCPRRPASPVREMPIVPFPFPRPPLRTLFPSSSHLPCEGRVFVKGWT